MSAGHASIHAHTPSELSDDALLDFAQQRSFAFFWEGAHPASGLARDTLGVDGNIMDDKAAIGGSGFAVMAFIVAIERGWISRDAALERLFLMLDALERATSYHGVFAHFIDGRTSSTIRFDRKDDGGDLVETALLFQGLLCARQYFSGDGADEIMARERVTRLWRDVEWSWHKRDGVAALTWHWSPNNGFSLAHEIRGWNECLIVYVLASGSPTFAVEPRAYHEGWAQGPDFENGRSYYDIKLPLGPAFGGPLFFAHYSFCGLDPRGLSDVYADYWLQNTRHVAIHIEHCRRNPGGFAGYGDACWGLTASDDPRGYRPHAPDEDCGVIAPTAALSSFPYAPATAMRALRRFHAFGEKLYGRFGFVDAFSEAERWFSRSHLAIDQGPIVAMIENHRSGLLWRLFMNDPDVQCGLRRLGFRSPRLSQGEKT
jgi:hypothetical protein